MYLDLNIIWFAMLGVLLAGYAVLDGFDLGVGMLSPLAKTDRERRLFIAAIGPIWDGNEVWLVTFGGALFAAFPEAYATIFSGLYIVFMLVLLALIIRAVSLEFRNQVESPFWLATWDTLFFSSSTLATLLFGVGVGNAMVGVPLTTRGIYDGGFFNLLNVYSLSVGLLAVMMFLMHGAIFLLMKTSGELRERIQRWAMRSYVGFVAAYALVTILTLIYVPRATASLASYPTKWLVIVLNIAAVVAVGWFLQRKQAGRAFGASVATIAAFVMLLGLALFPNLVTSSPIPENSLTIYNAASSQTTLQIMLIIAMIGMPFVLAYTGLVYWIFRGEATLEDH